GAPRVTKPRPARRTRQLVFAVLILSPLFWGALMWPLLRPSPHDLRNWRSLVPEWAVSALVNVGFAASPLTPVNPDLNGDGQVDIRDIQQVTACWMRSPTDPGCDPADLNRDQAIDVLDISIVAQAWHHTTTTLVWTSPTYGERDVAVTRETIFHFSAPLDIAGVVPSTFTAQFAGQSLSYFLYVSADARTVTLFYDQYLPANARITITIDGDALADAQGYAIDLDGDGAAGGDGTLVFDTLTLTILPDTVVCGHVFASELAPGGGGSVNVPLEGATITVDGAEATLRDTTDVNGDFCLDPAPAGSFFVHIDGRTAVNNVPPGAYYPFVGKRWDSVPGDTTDIGNVYLPLIEPGTLQNISTTEPTTITVAPSVIAAHPEFALAHIVVPPNNLFADNGVRGGLVGMAPVPADRLPGPLPPGLDLPIVITVQTSGPSNFDLPVAACFPNLPLPATGQPLPPGAESALWSFNHDIGEFQVVGGMHVSADGTVVCTDPGEGIIAPGWHGSMPGTTPDSGDDGPPCERDAAGCAWGAYTAAADCAMAFTPLGCIGGGLYGAFATGRDCVLAPDWQACAMSAGSNIASGISGCAGFDKISRLIDCGMGLAGLADAYGCQPDSDPPPRPPRP
ncbi:MAG: dockerin type I domain-containing protein, partial [Anaerolineae bacterium]